MLQKMEEIFVKCSNKWKKYEILSDCLTVVKNIYVFYPQEDSGMDSAELEVNQSGKIVYFKVKLFILRS